MDRETFKQRAYVGLVLLGVCLVVGGFLKGAEVVMAAFAGLGAM